MSSPSQATDVDDATSEECDKLSDFTSAPELHVLDPEGDVILRIWEDFEDVEVIKQEEDEDQFDIEEELTSIERSVNKNAATYEIIKDGLIVSESDFMKDGKNLLSGEVMSDTVLVRVSRDKLCQASWFFRVIFTKSFAETQLTYSKRDPPLVNLRWHPAYALGILRAIYQPEDFKDYVTFTWNGLVEFLQLTEIWDCTKWFQLNVDTNGIAYTAFKDTESFTVLKDEGIFCQQIIRDALDFVELMYDRESAYLLDRFIMKYLQTDIEYVECERSLIFLSRTQSLQVIGMDVLLVCRASTDLT